MMRWSFPFIRGEGQDSMTSQEELCSPIARISASVSITMITISPSGITSYYQSPPADMGLILYLYTLSKHYVFEGIKGGKSF